MYKIECFKIIDVVWLYLLSTAYGDWPESHKGRLKSQQITYPNKELYTEYCGKHDAGKYFCRLDLSGYHVCGRNEFVKCPSNTQCGCHLKNFCNMENPCVPYKTPYPTNSSATFVFDGENVQNYYWSEFTGIHHSLSGVVKQDVSNGKYLQITTSPTDGSWYNDGNTFQLILPAKDGSFVQYDGKSNGLCKKKIVTELQPFGSALKRFQLLKTQETENNKTLETYYYAYELTEYEWYFDAGRREWTFQVLVDSQQKTIIPCSSQYFRTGEDPEFYYRWNQTLQWTTSSLELPIPSKERWYVDWFDNISQDWFQPPPCCLYADIIHKARLGNKGDKRIKKVDQIASKQKCQPFVVLSNWSRVYFTSIQELTTILDAYSPMEKKCANTFHACIRRPWMRYTNESLKRQYNYYCIKRSKKYKNRCSKLCGDCKKDLKCVFKHGDGIAMDKIEVGVVETPFKCFESCWKLMSSKLTVNGATYKMTSDKNLKCWCQIKMIKIVDHKKRKTCSFV